MGAETRVEEENTKGGGREIMCMASARHCPASTIWIDLFSRWLKHECVERCLYICLDRLVQLQGQNDSNRSLTPWRASSPQLCPQLSKFLTEQRAVSSALHSRSTMIRLCLTSTLAVLFCWLQLALGADQVVLSENAKLSNETLLWGPYRPNLYFGVRPRIPKSLTTGLLWAKVDSFQDVQNSMSQRSKLREAFQDRMQ